MAPEAFRAQQGTYGESLGIFTNAEIRRKLLLRYGNTTAETWRRAIRWWQFRCAYCRDRNARLQRDHVVPLSKGGMDLVSNVVPACAACNASKGDQDVVSWMKSRRLDHHQFLIRWLQFRGDL